MSNDACKCGKENVCPVNQHVRLYLFISKVIKPVCASGKMTQPRKRRRPYTDLFWLSDNIFYFGPKNRTLIHSNKTYIIFLILHIYIFANGYLNPIFFL